jgi:hypothetical protein
MKKFKTKASFKLLSIIEKKPKSNIVKLDFRVFPLSLVFSFLKIAQLAIKSNKFPVKQLA